MSGVILLLLQYAFMAGIGASIPLPLHLVAKNTGKISL
jgi:hypothetical protein